MFIIVLWVTKQLLVPTDVDSRKKNMYVSSTEILQNIFFCVQHKNKNEYILQNIFYVEQKKETHSGLKQLERE